MEWRHLPYAGGYFDQDPEFLESVRVIRAAISKVNAEKKRREEANKNQHRIANQ